MRRACYRGTSLIENITPLGPYSRAMPRALWWSWGGGLFLISEVPLYGLKTHVWVVRVGVEDGEL